MRSEAQRNSRSTDLQILTGLLPVREMNRNVAPKMDRSSRRRSAAQVKCPMIRRRVSPETRPWLIMNLSANRIRQQRERDRPMRPDPLSRTSPRNSCMSLGSSMPLHLSPLASRAVRMRWPVLTASFEDVAITPTLST